MSSSGSGRKATTPSSGAKAGGYRGARGGRERTMGKKKRCQHGRQKVHCKVCSPCPHGKVKHNCAACNPCPHGKLKGNCVACNRCPHGKLKKKCPACKAPRAGQPALPRKRKREPEV